MGKARGLKPTSGWPAAYRPVGRKHTKRNHRASIALPRPKDDRPQANQTWVLTRVNPRVLAAGAAALYLLLTLGCARKLVEGKAEDRVNALLPRYLGPARRYETRISGDSTGALLRGHLRSVHIEGDGVQLTPTLTVDRLTLDFAEVAVDPKAGALRSVGSASFSCRITSDSLDRAVRAAHSEIPELSVALQVDQVIVRARPEALGIVPVPVSVEGTLIPRSGGTYLNFEPNRARLTILPIPGLVLDYLSRRLNPAVDLSDLRIPVHVNSSVVRGNFLHLSGTVAPDDLLRAAP